ncbi:hypothetical protein [Brevibacillus fulvus]|uniref:Uncharacterized protein n=1 Tax=Brevibacillus fulvus TaxID=1125967 RepID=A0A938XVI9_9BACL|nr:hypothetical protein [Brevibacillus fulvus]MBM7590917.1 hypothetical protein [Brevibacillus fulvus]
MNAKIAASVLLLKQLRTRATLFVLIANQIIYAMSVQGRWSSQV